MQYLHFKKFYFFLFLLINILCIVNSFRLVQDKRTVDKVKIVNIPKTEEQTENKTSRQSLLENHDKGRRFYKPVERHVPYEAKPIFKAKLTKKTNEYLEKTTKEDQNSPKIEVSLTFKENVSSNLSDIIEKRKNVKKEEFVPDEVLMLEKKSVKLFQKKNVSREGPRIEDRITKGDIKNVTRERKLNRTSLLVKQNDSVTLRTNLKVASENISELKLTKVEKTIEDKKIKLNVSKQVNKTTEDKKIRLNVSKQLNKTIEDKTIKLNISKQEDKTSENKEIKLDESKQRKGQADKKSNKPLERKKVPELVQTKSVRAKKQTETVPYLPHYLTHVDIPLSKECKEQVKVCSENLKEHKMWAIRMFDATATIASGVMRGNLNQLGDYDQCLNVHALYTPPDQEANKILHGKYCLASVDIEALTYDMRLPVNLAQGRAFLRSKIRDPEHFIPRFTTINWGVCAPSACDAGDVQAMMQQYAQIFNRTLDGIKLNISVPQEHCVVQTPPTKLAKLEYPTIITLSITMLIIVLNATATAQDFMFPESDDGNDNNGILKSIFFAFSLKRNMKSFLKKSGSDEINCIHGIRAIFTILLYIAHKLIPLGHSPFTNRVVLTELSNHPLSIILRISVIYTDTFLLLSGVLSAYHMSKDMENRGYISFFSRTCSRFIRLIPTLLLILLYYAYIMEHTGEGPLWNSVIKPNAKLCQDSWWKNLMFMQNIYPFEQMCATQTHQLALDLQLFLFAPILVWLLYQKPVLGIISTLLLHICSAALRYYTTMNYKLSLIIYHGISVSQLYRTANFLYASTLHRATPYVAGVGLGVLLRRLGSHYHVPKILSILGWTVTAYIIAWVFYTPSHLSKRTYVYDKYEAAHYAAYCSLAWAAALSWIILKTHLNQEGIINNILVCRPLVLLSKISYPLYLVQFLVFFYNVGTIKTASEFNISSLMNMSEFAVIIIISTTIFLSVDLPTQRIKNVLSFSKPTEAEIKEPEELRLESPPNEKIKIL